MKKIEGIGISPAPWQIDLYDGYVTTSTGLIVAVADGDSADEGSANTNLIAAAPELYECLREAVEMKREVCTESDCTGADFFDSCTECNKEYCCARKWYAVLAKAAGENRSSNENEDEDGNEDEEHLYW